VVAGVGEREVETALMKFLLFGLWGCCLVIFSVGSSDCTTTTCCLLPKTEKLTPASELAGLKPRNTMSVLNENHHAWTGRERAEEAFSSFGQLWESEIPLLDQKKEYLSLIWFDLWPESWLLTKTRGEKTQSGGCLRGCFTGCEIIVIPLFE
jgi:hypothetical protein